MRKDWGGMQREREDAGRMLREDCTGNNADKRLSREECRARVCSFDSAFMLSIMSLRISFGILAGPRGLFKASDLKLKSSRDPTAQRESAGSQGHSRFP